jgi:uncharacterized protein with NRDE domain
VCTVILGLAAHPALPVIVAANRDEFRSRQTAPYTELEPGIFGGRDLVAGGTWFAVRKDGAMALLTNIHLASPPDPSRKSRGAIVLELLRLKTVAEMRRHANAIDVDAYNPFSVLFGVAGEWCCLRGASPKQLVTVTRGWHVLGNVGFDAADDPKTQATHRVLEGVEHLPTAAVRSHLEATLQREPFWLERGIYGSRWSMVSLADTLWISETGVVNAPLTPVSLG